MNSVFELTKASIENCEYNLGEKLRELTLFKIVGQISSDEYSELVQLAYEHADPATTQTNVLMALKAINEEIAKVNARLDALEASNDNTSSEDEFPEWERWNGLPDSGYKFGDKVTHLGVKYVSNYVGLNVWEPGLQGTEALWSIIT